MYKSVFALLIALAISTPAQAEIFGFFAANNGPEQVVDGHVHAPVQGTFADNSMHGYPFYSGCCESKSSCCDGLWNGYCGSKGCGLKHHRMRHFGHLKGGCGCDACSGSVYGHGSCGKGGCGHAAPCGCGAKAGWGHLKYRGLGKSCGGFGAPCGGKGCATSDPCGPRRCRLGLFDWMHFGHGHGCAMCGGAGCSSCGVGKGGFGKGGYYEYAPAPSYDKVQGYDNGYYGTPTEAEENSTLQPPEVLVEPTSTSDRSAWRRQMPSNPFTRPFSF